MDDLQTNRVRMIRATATYCGTTPVTSATSGISAFAPMVLDTNNKLVLIDGFDMIAVGNSKGVTENTGIIRSAMEAIAFRCARGTFAFASATNVPILKAQVDFTRNKLEKKKMDEIDDVCSVIQTATNSNIGSVTAYGVLAGDPAALTAAIALYRTSISSTRQSIITKTGAIDQMETLIKTIIADNFKGQMDAMIDTLIGTNDEVVRGYKQARVILDLGHTTGKIRGVCRDENDDNLAGVLFTVKNHGTTTIVKQMTTLADGNFGASNLLGDYDCTWEKAGRITVAETIHVGPGKELKRRVRMMPV